MEFIDRVVTNPNKYKIIYDESSEDIVTLVPQETVIVEGTRLNAENLNKLVDSTSVDSIVTVTMAEYEAIVDSSEGPDEHTLYLIKED